MFSRGQQNPAGAAGSPGCPRDRKRSLPARRSAARLRTAAPGEAGLTSREEKTATRRHRRRHHRPGLRDATPRWVSCAPTAERLVVLPMLI